MSSTWSSDSKGDHPVPKKPSKQKCEVYVHHYNKIPRRMPEWSESEIHRNTYDHEYSDYYQKLNSLKEQFDTLSLQAGLCKSNRSKMPSVKSMPISKINKLLGYKAAADRLEETYWSKWKPPKGNKKEGPAKDDELLLMQEVEKLTKEFASEEVTNNITYEPSLTESVRVEIPEKEPSASLLAQPEPAEDAKVETPVTVIQAPQVDKSISTTTLIAKKSSEIILKHTDSFILTSKKQSVEKTRYQQPKRIKLFKNAGYVSCTCTNFIKGGSYPLRSCLKKVNSGGTYLPKASYLGRPGSPIKSTGSAKSGKKKHFSK